MQEFDKLKIEVSKTSPSVPKIQQNEEEDEIIAKLKEVLVSFYLTKFNSFTV
jgi:hypothetical protein